MSSIYTHNETKTADYLDQIRKEIARNRAQNTSQQKFTLNYIIPNVDGVELTDTLTTGAHTNLQNNTDSLKVQDINSSVPYAVFTAIESGPSAAPGGGLVLYLKFENNALDSSDNNHTFTPINSPSYGAGKQKYAVVLNGSTQYLQAPNNTALDQNTNDFSIAAWIKPTNLGTIGIIFSKKSTSGTAAGYRMGITSLKKLFAEICDGTASVLTEIGDTVLTNNTWYFATVTFDRDDKMKVYLNSIVDSTPATISSQQGSITNTLTAMLGRNAGGSAEYYAGYVDNLKIYNKALTQQEVYSLYLSNSINHRQYKFANLQGYYRFDGDGNDYSGNGQNLTLTGTSSFTNGKIDNAFDFNGATYYEAASAAVHDMTTNDFSITAWVNLDTVTSGYIATKRTTATTTSKGYRFGLSASGRLYGELCDGTADVISKSAGTILSTGTWYHVCTSYDRDNNMSFFINGVLDATQSIAAQQNTISDNTIRFRVGRASSTSGIYLDGRVDDLRIYNVALTEEDVKYIYQNYGIMSAAALADFAIAS